MDRFWSRVDRCGPDECWPWLGRRNGYGYGVVWLRDSDAIASRVAAALSIGFVSADDVVRHACDNPPCCNPAHLSIGTHSDNSLDRERRGRGVNARPEESGGSKLTRAQVDEIRQRYAAGGISQAALGRAFGVVQQEVSNIVRGQTW